MLGNANALSPRVALRRKIAYHEVAPVLTVKLTRVLLIGRAWYDRALPSIVRPYLVVY